MTIASQIYQANLDAVSAAVMTGDLPVLRRHVAIPIMLYGPASEVVVSSIEEMEILIFEYRQQLIARGFTSYDRTCLSAQFQPGMPDMILGHHSTLIMAGRAELMPRFDVQMALMRIEGQWKAIWQQVVAEEAPIEFLARDITDAQKKAHAAFATQGGARR
jgi:hypothetical protein